MIGRVGSRKVRTIEGSILRRRNLRIHVQLGERPIAFPLEPEYVPIEVVAIRSVGVSVIPDEAERLPELRGCSARHPEIVQLPRSFFNIEELIRVVGAIVPVNVLVIKRRTSVVEEQGTGSTGDRLVELLGVDRGYFRERAIGGNGKRVDLDSVCAKEIL